MQKLEDMLGKDVTIRHVNDSETEGKIVDISEYGVTLINDEQSFFFCPFRNIICIRNDKEEEK